MRLVRAGSLDGSVPIEEIVPGRPGPLVSYSARFEGAALVQLDGLPAAADVAGYRG